APVVPRPRSPRRQEVAVVRLGLLGLSRRPERVQQPERRGHQLQLRLLWPPIRQRAADPPEHRPPGRVLMRRWILLCLLLMGWAAACAPGFDSVSKVNTLRILA